MPTHDEVSLARRGHQQASIGIAFLALAWLFIALRIWTRTFIIANFGWDDLTMILAGLIFSIFCSSMLYINTHGGGTHITSIEELSSLTKWVIVGEATYIIGIMLLKISLGIFFARIVVKRWQTWTIYGTLALVVLSSTSCFFYILFRCGGSLDAYVTQQAMNKCTPQGLDRFFAYQQAAVTSLTDCVFALLPIMILWNASMDLRSKVSVGLILSLAALGCVCSAIRFQYVDGLTLIDDFFWNTTSIALWSTIELGIGIIVGCMATLRPFLKVFIRGASSIRSSVSHSTRQMSRSFRSNEHSATDKSADRSSHRQKSAASEHQDMYGDPHRNQNDNIELQSEISKKTGSAEYILTQSDTDRPWSSPQDYNFDLDSRSLRSSFSKQSSRVHRGMRFSDTFDSPLPPLPLDSHSRHDDIV